jgi:ATP-dependent helicase HepA
MLVSLPGRRGVASVVANNGATCQVALFHSINEAILEEHPVSALKRALVGPETRVYVTANGTWRIGRIKDFDLARHPVVEYVVRFPNGMTLDLSENQLRVRIFEPHADPTEVLAQGGGETQFLHDRRWAAVADAIALRAAAQGLTGALSSKIELVPHQLAAARRVLTDPTPRFLLADEVGMGKTIEAGIVARQCLIDDPTRTVHVLAPAPLVPQWRQELSGRFDLGDFAGQVQVSPHDAHWPSPLDPPDLLIVDEAHNLLQDPALRRRLTALAHPAPRLLLLSATPALGDPQQLLNLLHVLDPAAYGPDDFAKLEARLELGRDLGRILLALAEDAPPFLVRRAADDIAKRVPGDEVVQQLVETLAATDDLAEPLADLRQHLADTYRVHQRLVRARRRDAAVYFRPRGVLVDGRRDHVRDDADEDLRWPEILGGLEDWRDTLRLSSPKEGPARDTALKFLATIEALGADPDGTEVSDSPPSLRSALAADRGDRERSVVAADLIKALFKRVRQDGEARPKVVAFGSAAMMVDRVLQACEIQEIPAFRLRSEDTADAIDATVKAFREALEASVLLCDTSGEEGLNLNFADAILHLDLPFSVSRLEQRIGRLDRFGRVKARLRQRILIPSDDELGPWAAWLEVLAKGFDVFETSTSDVQFILPDLEGDLACAYLARGADGLREMIDSVRSRLADARRAADEQYALDTVALADDATELALGMEDAEADEGELQAHADAWLLRALQFSQVRRDAEEVSYAWTNDTLVPRQPWKEEFAADPQRRYTWRRTVAMRRAASLLRPGAPLLDAMERHQRWDDRGSAFATWRTDPSLAGNDIAWSGFRFCFVIEPALAEGLSIFKTLDVHGLMRRAQAFLPSWTHVLHIDFEGEDPSPETLSVLQRPYDDKVRPQGGRDINLCSRPALLATVMSPATFAAACRDARAAAEDRIRRDSHFQTRIAKATQAAERDQRRRARRTVGLADDGSEAVLQAVRQPRLRLDAMGFFVLSRQPPPMGLI